MAYFSPTDESLICLHPIYNIDHLSLVEAPSGRIVNIWSNRVDAFCFSPDGQTAAVWSRTDFMIRVHRVPEGSVGKQWSTGQSYVLRMAFSPDGKLLAAGNLETGAVDLFAVADGSLIARLEGQSGRFASLAFSPDGKLLATGNYDQSIHIWDLVTQREVRRLHGHRSAALALAFSPDGTRLASGGFDGTVRFWDVDPPATQPAITNASGAIAFSNDGHWLLTQHSNRTVALWELPVRRKSRDWDSPPFAHAVFTSNGKLVTLCPGDSNEPPSLRFYSVEKPALQASLPLRGVASECTAAVLSADGVTCATGHEDGTVAFWEAGTGRLLGAAHQAHRVPSGPPRAPVGRLAFSADGRLLASVGRDSLYLKTWLVPERRELARRLFPNYYDLALDVSPDGREIAIGGHDQGLAVNFWSPDLKASLRRFEGHQEFLHAIAYSPDGRTLATGTRDGILKLWHLPTGRQLGTLVNLQQKAKFRQLVFSRDGSWLGALLNDGSVRLWHGPPAVEAESAFQASTDP